MDSILGNTVVALSHALGISATGVSLLIGIVLLFIVYKIIDLA